MTLPQIFATGCLLGFLIMLLMYFIQRGTSSRNKDLLRAAEDELAETNSKLQQFIKDIGLLFDDNKSKSNQIQALTEDLQKSKEELTLLRKNAKIISADKDRLGSENQYRLEEIAQLKNKIQQIILENDQILKGKEEELQKLSSSLHEANSRANELIAQNGDVDALKEIAENYRHEIMLLQEQILVSCVDISAFESINSEECKNKLQILKAQEEKLIKDGRALVTTKGNYSSRTLENNKKQILRCFNSECASIIESVSPQNVDSARAKIKRTFDTLNRIFVTDSLEIDISFLELKYDELSLVYAYRVKREQEKEIQRAIKEQLAEEEKARQELAHEKERLLKESQQFQNELSKLMDYMSRARDEIQIRLYSDKIHEVEEKLKELEIKMSDVCNREINTRAGFVYVISNIGSFGEGVYKIGMTRRLEPMDRIKELSSASVPFPFDVHAIIFSNDAPALETLLHQTFREHQVNKINPRKEFFRVDINQIKKIVHKNHNAVAEFINIADAEEYRETMRMELIESKNSAE